MKPLLAHSRMLLPEDHNDATLIGRVWLPASGSKPGGPTIVHVTDTAIYDLSADFPTLTDLLHHHAPADLCRSMKTGNSVASFDEIAANTLALKRDTDKAFFISPIDLQPVKACGVTFYESLVERIIEERAEGNPELAFAIRVNLTEELGVDFSTVIPGSAQALELLELLKRENLWSQYLEVGLGIDAEVFTKAPPLASVGTGAEIGILPVSLWNNPEPEVTLLINANAKIVGVTLGNDVNHRDIEGRSALLLGKAKDNNAACALGPFIRLLDKSFTLDHVRNLQVKLEVEGVDAYTLQAENLMSNIRRDILDLVNQCIGPCNDYPDGVALMLGAMSSPTQDRDEEGAGFTHKIGDIVRISSPKLGILVNRIQATDKVTGWKFGINDLMKNLAQRSCL